MTSRRKQVETLFQAAADLPPEERSVFLDGQPGIDPDVRADVDRLLRVLDTDIPDDRFVQVPREEDRQPITRPAAPSTERGAKLPEYISHYRIERELGRGGMGRVYVAVDEKLDRKVAIKKLFDEVSTDARRLEMFEREARAAAKVNHPNIATVHELAEHEGQHHIVMEYVEGRTLNELVRPGEPLPPSDLLDYGIQMTKGLAAAHDEKIVHRDLKPANVMVSNDGLLKILDFGIAKALRETLSQDDPSTVANTTLPGMVLGTPGYMSPEQAYGQTVDHRTDLFALGVVLYEMATGNSPFLKDETGDSRRATIHEHPPAADTINPAVPEKLAKLIAKLMAKKPEDRYQSADEVLEELGRVSKAEESPDRTLTRFAIICAAVVIGTLIVVLWPDPKPPPTVVLTNREFPSVESRLRTFVDPIIHYVADGEHSKAEENFEEMKELDPDHLLTLKAEKLVNTGGLCRDETDRIKLSIGTRLKSETLDDLKRAGNEIQSLREQKIEKRKYTPADEAANKLAKELIQALSSLASRLPDSERVDLQKVSDILETVGRGAERDVEKRIATIGIIDGLLERAVKASKEGNPYDLREVIQLMQRLKPRAEKTKERLENETVRVLAMRDRLLRRIDDKRDNRDKRIQRAEVAFTRFDLQAMDAARKGLDREPDELRRARDWLERLETARKFVAENLKKARSILLSIDSPSRLAPEFRSAGQLLIDGVKAAILGEERKSEALELCKSIKDYCDRLRVRDARTKLVKLEELLEMSVTGVDNEVEDARTRVKLIRIQNKNREGFNDRLLRILENFRLAAQHKASSVRERKFTEAETESARLRADWLEVRDTLDKALALERDEKHRSPLLLERSVLHLRLGDYGKALEDAEQSQKPSEATLLVCGQAKYALWRQVPEDLKPLDSALRCFERALEMNKASARAFYWCGVCEHELAMEREQARPKALTSLIKAFNLGLVSGPAYYRRAVILLNKREFSKAIGLATHALREPFLLDDVIARFGGSRFIRREVEWFRRDIYQYRGEAHLATDSEECIKDFGKAIEIDPTSAWCYLVRGRARILLFKKHRSRTDLWDAGMRDFAKAKTHAAKDRKRIDEISEWEGYAKKLRRD